MDTQRHLYDIIKDFRTAMLVTRSANGELHARPMAVAELQPSADAYFATGIDSPKIGEIETHPDVLVTFQSGSEFAVIQGSARIVRDRAEIDRLWSETWKVWFPRGKDDPSLCLLKVSARRGEYWDNSGLEGARYLFEGMKAVLQRRRPQIDQSQNAKVSL